MGILEASNQVFLKVSGQLREWTHTDTEPRHHEVCHRIAKADGQYGEPRAAQKLLLLS